MCKLKHFLKYLFSKRYRRFIKSYRDEVHFAILRERFPRVDCSYKEYLANGNKS